MAWASYRVIDPVVGRSLIGQMISVSAAAAVGGIGYLATAHALRMSELSQLTRLVRALR
jgi:hypothetical protein